MFPHWASYVGWCVCHIRIPTENPPTALVSKGGKVFVLAYKCRLRAYIYKLGLKFELGGGLGLKFEPGLKFERGLGVLSPAQILSWAYFLSWKF